MDRYPSSKLPANSRLIAVSMSWPAIFSYSRNIWRNCAKLRDTKIELKTDSSVPHCISPVNKKDLLGRNILWGFDPSHQCPKIVTVASSNFWSTGKVLVNSCTKKKLQNRSYKISICMQKSHDPGNYSYFHCIMNCLDKHLATTV